MESTKEPSDIEKEPFLKIIRPLTTKHWLGIIGVIGTIAAVSFNLGRIYGEIHCKPAEKCTFANITINGDPLPPPGKAIPLPQSLSYINWDSDGCGATIQAYLGPDLVFTGEFSAPAAIHLERPGKYEVKIWDSRNSKLLSCFLANRVDKKS